MLKERILVALSGGVDSAVAASLLLDQGYKVEAVYVKTWEHEDDLLGDCPGAQDLRDARDVADKLQIPFRVLNLSDFYQKHVVDPMIEGYAEGVTPNPDVLCNREMKFGKLMDYAVSEGFTKLATGHYCRRIISPTDEVQLWEGIDKNKDQSYFLSRLTIEQLNKAIFPVGEIDKGEVRKIAKALGLGVADKKDSQGICFLGKVKVPEFLGNFIEDKPGVIITVDGRIVGRHKGLHRYTLGQRRGIGVPSNTDNRNYVVTGKDQVSNELIVAFEDKDEQTLWSHKYHLQQLSYLKKDGLPENSRLLAKARYRDPSTPIAYKYLGDNRAEVVFEQPQRALTPGQVLAFYEGERLVGAGIYSLQNLGRAALSA